MPENGVSENGTTLTPHDLITEDLVEQAVKYDFGQDAEVILWETKDFTNKGDNYSSVVTSITVKYRHNGQIVEKSYIAKLNPLRPVSAFTEIMDAMYSREAFVLREIFDGMNSQLSKLKLPPIKAPRLYARSLEKRKEAFITENLRTQEFKMYDRTKGMDINHALLVVEELGRIHASSLLFEETLFPKSIPEVYDYFKEPWIEQSHSSNKLSGMTIAQSKGACEMLKRVKDKSYDKCIKWLNNNHDNIGKFYTDGYTASKPMELFTHGDCWTNNFLFKYNDKGVPIDMRFVDLQCSRMSSPACDMNYFYYTSLNGDDRKKNMKTMEKSYYNSFQKVLELAGKEPPFTFSEFEIEMNYRKRFGFVAGLLVLPIVLAQGEDEMTDFSKVRDDNLDEFVKEQGSNFSKISQREGGAFKERFLSMFDEMLEYNIFDE